MSDDSFDTVVDLFIASHKDKIAKQKEMIAKLENDKMELENDKKKYKAEKVCIILYLPISFLLMTMIRHDLIYVIDSLPRISKINWVIL